MKDLFGEEKPKNSKSLKIVKKQNLLSKNQQSFNRLTQQIKNLEDKIQLETSKLDRLLAYYIKELKPTDEIIAHNQLELAKELHETTRRMKFSKRQLESIGNTVLDLCNSAFQTIEPSEEERSIYDYWSDTSYNEELENQKDALKQSFSEIISSALNMDIDFSKLDLDSPENSAAFFETLREEFERNNSEPTPETPKKKSKKQITYEEKQKIAEELKSKTLRHLYITLAKVLHPDTETDLDQKAEKEELMKKVTVAYDQKDITTLLRLEMDWVSKENAHLENLPDEKLKIYNSVLQEQVRELQIELNQLYYNPRFSEIEEFVKMKEPIAEKNIYKRIAKNKEDINSIEYTIKLMKRSHNKKDVMEFVENYYASDDDEMGEMLEFMMSMMGKNKF